VREVLAAIDDSGAAGPVLQAALAAGRVLGDPVRALHVSEGGLSLTAGAVARWAQVEVEDRWGDPVEEIVEAASRLPVELVVLAARDQPTGARPAGHVALAVVERSTRPVLVVPPDARLPAMSASDKVWPVRILVALDGTPETARGLAGLSARLQGCPVELVVVHVFEAATLPGFWYHAGHAEEAWEDAFRRRWCRDVPYEVQLRHGRPSSVVVDVADAEAIACVALFWSRCLAPGRALVVREALGRSPVPVLLVPAARDAGVV
jgi:nucleotide-binding universal stress UspA family protein